MEKIEKRAFRSKEADERQGFPVGTHKLSRHTGVLYGEEPPPFIKIGKAVFYRKEDLDAWLDRFPRYRNTAEATLAKQVV